MNSTQFWVGMLVPSLVKRAVPFLKNVFKLPEFDPETQKRVTSKHYPAHYSALYNLWQISLIANPVVFLVLSLFYLPQLFPDKQIGILLWVVLINFFGSIFLLGAILDVILWCISSHDFKDYVMFRQIKVGWGFEIKQQIVTLLKIWIIYSFVTLPLVVYLLRG